MRILNQQTELAPLDTIRPHPNNTRQGNLPAITESITTNGFYGTVVAQRSTGYILAGNHRWKAALAEGATEIPVTWVEVDDDEAKRILLADNRTNDLAGYDDEALVGLLRDMGDLTGTGYTNADLDELTEILNGPTTEAWATALDALPDGERAPFQQMTFTLHDTQAARITQALDRAKATGDFGASPNANSNGNALAAIAEAYING